MADVMMCPKCDERYQPERWSKMPLLGWLGESRQDGRGWLAVEIRRCCGCDEPIASTCHLPSLLVHRGEQ